MKIRLLGLAILLAVSACAKRPDAIVATDIPMAAYTGDPCAKIANELVQEQANLASLSKQQNQAATGDAAGVFLIGIPMSSAMGGDKEGLIASSKGKINAMQAALHSKGCD